MTEIFEQFVRSGLYLRGWSTRTPDVYRRAFTSFQQSLHDSPGESLAALTKAQLEAWVMWMRERGLSPSCINIYIRSMNSFLAWLADENHVTERLKVKQVKASVKLVQAISDRELKAVLAFRPKYWNDMRAWTLICVLLDTGCRIDEILSLKTADVDLDNLLLTVKGKGSKYRRVPVSLELRKTLFRFISERTRRGLLSPFVFCARSGQQLRYRNAYRDLKSVFEKVGVKGEHIHPHALRHCFAVNYVRHGGDVYRLSRILGHSSITTTATYLRSNGSGNDWRESLEAESTFTSRVGKWNISRPFRSFGSLGG